MGIARKPEVMSPAGYWPQLEAALDAGADAVYFGLRHFTARAKVGFEPEELPQAMAALHRRGARGFVTFNTLVFDHELREAARALAAIAEAGADAIIVQDLGVLKLARAIAPDLEIHASTQMSVTNADGVAPGRELGRAARHTGARAFARRGARHPRRNRSCELEIFVHGALCVAYSGQCFSSRGLGRPQRQPRPVRAGLPLALRADRGWQGEAARRRPLSALAGRPVRVAPDSGDRRDRHRRAQDRGPLQGRRLRGAVYARLPPGRGRRVGRPRRRPSTPAPELSSSNRSIRAASGRTS